MLADVLVLHSQTMQGKPMEGIMPQCQNPHESCPKQRCSFGSEGSLETKTKKRASLVVSLLILTSTFYIAFTVVPENVRGNNTLYVGGIGPGNYTTIQSAIDAASPGNTIYVYSGTYYEYVLVNKTISLKGEDRNTTIIDAGGIEHVVYVTADWVNVTGFTVRNGRSDFREYAGIKLHNVQNCHIADNIASNSGAGIYLYSSSHNTVTNNIVFSNSWYGIYIHHFSTDNAITNNLAYMNGREGIIITFYNNNTIVAGNIVSENLNGITLTSSNNTTVINNFAFSNLEIGISIFWSPNTTITNNNAISNGGFGFYLWFSENDTVSDNTASGSLYGIFSSSSNNNTIVNNDVSSNDWDGIFLRKSHNNTVANNTASFNSKYGILLDSSENNTIVDNSASDNWAGIALWTSNFNTVAENTISSNMFGIYLSRYSYHNTVANNVASSNDGEGIYLYSSDRNLIVGNTASLNKGYGIYLDFSSNNRVYHNNITDNTRQAYDNTDANQWDDGYPSGGNHWSDYTGLDQMSGPNQDLPGRDGIGDTPYVIDIDSRDRYPLMAPFENLHPRPPALLQATLTGEYFENVTFTWTLSLDDGAGAKSVIGYKIYRNMTYNPEGLGYQPIASLSNGTSCFIDNMTGEGNPNGFFYQVCAIDSNNNSTCAKNQAGKFTHPISEGPNLISIPLIQSNENIRIVLQTVKWDKAWSYDLSIQKWEWHMRFKPYLGEFERVSLIEGLWVNVTEDSNLTVAGIVPSTTAIHLHEGWNLVGFPSFNSSYTVSDLKTEVNSTRLEGFDSSNPPYFLKLLASADKLQPGFGYWVRVELEITWIVGNL